MLKHLAILAVAAIPLPCAAVEFPTCRGGHRVTCVVDGDTFWLEGEKFRLEGYDAPEMGAPNCSRPAAGAVESRAALAELLASGALGIERHGRSYDRTVAVVTVDGIDIADVMIRAGHARRYTPGQEPWC